MADNCDKATKYEYALIQIKEFIQQTLESYSPKCINTMPILIKLRSIENKISEVLR